MRRRFRIPAPAAAALVLAALALTAVVAPAAQAADWHASLGYTRLSEDGPDGSDVVVGILVGSLGYRLENDAGFALIPEVRVGTGIDGDTVRLPGVGPAIEVDVKSFVGLTVRGEYAFTERIAVFAQPTYANLETEASSGGQSATGDEWQLGFGAGIGLRAGRRGQVDLFAEDFDGSLLITGSYRRRF